MNFNISKRTHLLAVLSITLLFGCASRDSHAGQSAHRLRVENFQAEYAIEVAGITVGRLSRRFEIKPNGDYEFKSASKTAGLTALFQRNRSEETASGVLSNGTFVPRHYINSREKGSKRKQETLAFDHENKIVTKQRKGQVRQHDLSGAVFDPLSYQLQLMLDLRSEKPQASYTIHSAKKEKRYIAEILDSKLIETPFGSFNSLELRENTQSSKSTTFWCAEELNYLPIKVVIEDDGRTTQILLESYNGLRR